MRHSKTTILIALFAILLASCNAPTAPPTIIALPTVEGESKEEVTSPTATPTESTVVENEAVDAEDEAIVVVLPEVNSDEASAENTTDGESEGESTDNTVEESTTDSTSENASEAANREENNVSEDVATDAAAVLPAPVYYIGAKDEQVMRLERDGATISQITSFAEPITAFDFSAETGTLVVVRANQLLAISDNNEQLLFDGGAFNPDDQENFVGILKPDISPDGTQVVFGYGGILMMPLDGSTPPQQLLENAELPDFSDPNVEVPEGPLYFFGEAAYSPDGQRLLINFGYFPEGGGLGVYNLADSTFTDLSQAAFETESVSCCEFAWSADSSTGYIISDLMIYGFPGLAQVNFADNSVRSVVRSEFSSEEPLKMFRSGHVAADGSLLTFAGSSVDFGQAAYYELNRVTPEGEQSLLGDRFFNIGYNDVLWADDSSGVLFTEQQFGSRFDSLGGTRWINVNDNSILELPISGSQYVWGAAPQAVTAISAEAVEQLKARALSDFAIVDGWTVDDIIARPLLIPNQRMWVVHTAGLRSYEPLQEHSLGLYRYANNTWEPIYLGDLGPESLNNPDAYGPDYIGFGSVQQAFIEPDNLWLLVTGGVGAHGGALQLLKFDGTTMTQAASGFNGSPFAGYVEDLDGDGWQELILDQTDPYVFCYACGVRLANFTIMRWNGESLEAIELRTVDGDSAEIAANNTAVNFANANLWNDAEFAIRPYELSDNPIIRWNAEYILLTASGRSQLTESAYPLITRMFYGDYAGATFAIGDLTMEEIFDINGPLIAGTVADGWTDFMLPQIIDFSTQAILAQPDNAGAHFLRGWAAYLLNPEDPNAVADILKSAELGPDNYLYPSAAAYFGGE